MSLESSLKLLMSLDPKSWRDIQGFRMNRHGPDRELCDLEVQDHVQGVVQRKIAERGFGLRQDYTPWYSARRRYQAFVSFGTQNGEMKEGEGENHAEAILAAYCACLQELA